MSTPQRPQKGHYNDAEDKKNLLNGSPIENAGNDNGGDGGQMTPSPTTILPTTATPTYGGYEDIINLMKSAQEATKKDEDAARRQERLARVHSFTSGIGDLGRAIANMYFTTQYAPNGYDHGKDGLSEKAKARADKWRAERQRLQKEYYNYAMQGANAKNSRDAFKAQQERYAEQLRQSQERIDQTQQKEENRRAEAEAKVRAETIKQGNRNYLNLMMAAMRDGKYDRRAAVADLDAMVAAGVMDDDEYKARLQTLDSAEASYASERSKAEQAARRKAASGSGSGRKNNTNPYDTGQQSSGSGGGTSVGSGSKQKTPTMLQKNNNSKTPSMLQ